MDNGMPASLDGLDVSWRASTAMSRAKQNVRTGIVSVETWSGQMLKVGVLLLMAAVLGASCSGGSEPTAATAPEITAETVATRTCSSTEFNAGGDGGAEILVSLPTSNCGLVVTAAQEKALSLVEDEQSFELIFASRFAFWFACEAMQTNVEYRADYAWEPDFAEFLNDEGLCPGDPSMVVAA